MTEYIQNQLNILNTIFKNSIQKNNDLSERCYDTPPALLTAPPSITIRLWTHQTALANAMVQKTTDLLSGKNNVFSRMAILGDPSNTGKTLTALSFLSKIGDISPPRLLSPDSNPYFYSFDTADLNTQHQINVVLVPHYLFNQWQKVITSHTTLKFHFINTKKSIPSAPNSIQNVLISNKTYKNFYKYSVNNNIVWKILLIDEVNNIYLPPNIESFFNITKFTWFITSNWIPLIFKQSYFSFRDLNNLLNENQHCGELVSFIKSNLDNYFHWRMESSSFFKNYLPFNNIKKTDLLLRTSDQFLKESLSPTLSSIQYNIISKLCRPTINLLNMHEFYVNSNDRIDNMMPTIFRDLNIPIQSAPNIEIEDCAICLDNPRNPVIYNCCNHTYCAYCGLKNVILRGSCPLCRSQINTHNVVMIDSSDHHFIFNQNEVKNKLEAVNQYIQDNSGDSILIYSSHKNIYYNLLSSNIINLDQSKTPNGRLMFLSNFDSISGLKMDIKHLIFYSDSVEEILKNRIINSIELNSGNSVDIILLKDSIPI